MVLKSGLLEKRLWESGYKCLADRGFTVCDLFDDLSQAAVAVVFTETRPTLCRRNDNESANCCGKVHVEQRNQRLKRFQIFSQPLPLKMEGSLNQMMAVCARYKASEIIVMDQVQKYMDGPRLLRMRLGELVPLVRVELRSWGLASLPSLHSLAWNCTLGVGVSIFPSLRSLAWNCTLGVGVSISPLLALVSVELRS